LETNARQGLLNLLSAKKDINVLDHFTAGIFQEGVKVNSAAFAAQQASSLIF